jgi:hypothetical protein
MEVKNESGKAEYLDYLFSSELGNNRELREQKGLLTKGG